jgi:hypothetical protein
MGAPLFHCTHDLLDDSRSFPKNLIVPEPENQKSPVLQLPVTSLILLAPLHVLPAIDFYHDLCFEAREISDIRSDWDLSPEAESGNLSLSEPLPKMSFDIGGISS